jgi:hypothetical protein
LTVEAQLTCGRAVEADDAAAERRLPRSRLADEAQHLSPGHVQVDAVDRPQDVGRPLLHAARE